MTTSPATQVANMETELISLREKSEADDKMIALLTKQNETQAMEMSLMAGRFAEESRRLRQRCDEATRSELEVEGILNTAAKSIVEGLRKRAANKSVGWQPPEEQPKAPLPQVQEVQKVQSRIPVLTDDHLEIMVEDAQRRVVPRASLADEQVRAGPPTARAPVYRGRDPVDDDRIPLNAFGGR